MIISLKRKFAFLCMPKCASTSTENALRRLADIRIGGLPGMKHLNYRGYEKYVVPLIEEAGVEREGLLHGPRPGLLVEELVAFSTTRRAQGP